MSEWETFTGKIEKEFDALRSLARRRPKLFWTVLVVAVFILGWFGYDKVQVIPRLRQRVNAKDSEIEQLKEKQKEKLEAKDTEIQKLKERLTGKDTEIQRLETQLAPFRTLALQRYPGPESEGLRKLGEEIEELEREVSTLREYAEVARWTLHGNRSLGGGTEISSPVAGWTKDYIVEQKDNRVKWKCNRPALEYYRNMTIIHPRYPFPYYFLAKCLRALREDSWRDYAQEGIRILEKTTRIAGHDPSHDDALRELRHLLEE
jgi:cell division protein FtsB